MATQIGNAFTSRVSVSDPIIHLTVHDNNQLQEVTVRRRPEGTTVGGEYSPTLTTVFYALSQYQQLLQAVAPGSATFAEAKELGRVVRIQVDFDDQTGHVTGFICSPVLSTLERSKVSVLDCGSLTHQSRCQCS